MSTAHTFSNRNTQHGVALAMALVFLLLLTLLGLASMSTSSLEEKMATNTRDRSLAFHAAETALMAGETWINSLAADPATWPEPAKGKYLPITNAAPNWETAGIWNGTNVISYPCTPTDGTPNVGSSCDDAARNLIDKVSTQPKYIVEKMETVSAAPLKIAYRVTARGTGSSNASVVMLQSVYVKQF